MQTERHRQGADAAVVGVLSGTPPPCAVLKAVPPRPASEGNMATGNLSTSKRGYKTPLSSLYLPPGAEHSFQYKPGSVNHCPPTDGTLLKLEQWRSQRFDPPEPIESALRKWGETRQDATWKPEQWGHHANKFYADTFHLLSECCTCGWADVPAARTVRSKSFPGRISYFCLA